MEVTPKEIKNNMDIVKCRKPYTSSNVAIN